MLSLNMLINKFLSKLSGLTRSRRRAEPALTLIGPFNTYEEASRNSSGYNDKVILDKVCKAVLDVLEGHRIYERDGTCFSQRPSPDNLRRLLIAHLKDDDIVVDFGGGLGGSFINNRDLFSDLHHCIVVEQASFVSTGRHLSLKHRLNVQFVDSLSDLSCKPDIVILSSVLQYIPNAEQVLQTVAELMPRLILIDRTALARDLDSEKWWIQNEPSYYRIPVSYPNRPLAMVTLLRFFRHYSVVEKWQNSFDPAIPPHRGFLLSRCA